MALVGSKYMDFKGADDPAPHGGSPASDPNYRQSVVITPYPPAGPGWHAVWDKNQAGSHEEHIAPTRDSAIAWAKERCSYVLAYDEDVGDLVEVD